jgi:subtilisin-like proprotein convertase family protein
VTVDGQTATSTKDFGVVTGTTYTSTDVPKSLPDYTNTSSTITVSGGPASISKVTVTLNISITWDEDLDIYLIAPDGTQITLSTDNGSAGDNYTNTMFDDSASASITSGSAPFSGAYRPESALSALNGKNANGTWTLSIYDDLGGIIGTLNAWSITVQ